jgi:hypothetical protein
MPTPQTGESEEDYMKRCMTYPDMQQYSPEQRAAICHSKFSKGDIKMNERKVSVDYSLIDDKIIVNNDDWLAMPITVASEIVQQYDDGYAYKPADELEKMAEVAELIGAKPIKILEHPHADTNYLVQRQLDVSGKAVNFRFVKNLVDAKTKRPCRKGVVADGYWSKKVTPPNVIDDIVKLKMRDCSIGFSFDKDSTPGSFDGSKYDYVQRNIYLDHVAAPIPAGRCPGPICGIGYDAKNTITYDASVECPVCRTIKDVGFAVAGKRLYKQYGPDVLEIIEGHPLPKIEPPKTSIDDEFNRAISELKKKMVS